MESPGDIAFEVLTCSYYGMRGERDAILAELDHGEALDVIRILARGYTGMLDGLELATGGERGTALVRLAELRRG